MFKKYRYERSNAIDNELLHTTINVSETPIYIFWVKTLFSGVMDKQIFNEIIEVLVSKK